MTPLLNPIMRALGSGISAKKILDFLSKKDASIGSRIKTALAAGLSAEKILDFIQKPENFQRIKQKVTQQQIDPNQAENPLVQAEEIKRNNLAQDSASRMGRGIGSAIKSAPILGAAYGLSKALPSVVPAISGALTQSSQQQQSPMPPGEQVVQQALQPTQQIPVPPPQPVDQGLNVSDLFEQMQVKDRIDNLVTAGNAPEQVAAALQIMLRPEQKKWLASQTPRGLPDLVAEYVQNNPDIAISEQQAATSVTQPQPEAAEPKGIDVGALVQLPNGEVGTIESVKGDSAVVNVDGKKKPTKLAKALTEPEEVRLALWDLLQISEEERSGPLDMVQYDARDKRLYMQFPNGRTAVYLDVDPDEAESIREGRDAAKTTGETRTGEKWIAGVPGSRGATAVKRIISNEKYSKANKDKTWYYLDEVYDKFKKLRLVAQKRKKRQ